MIFITLFSKFKDVSVLSLIVLYSKSSVKKCPSSSFSNQPAAVVPRWPVQDFCYTESIQAAGDIGVFRIIQLWLQILAPSHTDY